MRPRHHAAMLLAILGLAAFCDAQLLYRPSPEEVVANYKRAEEIGQAQRAAYKLQLTPNWIGGAARFWYVNRLSEGKAEYWLVDAENATRKPAFDHAKLADALGVATSKTLYAEKLALANLAYSEDLDSLKYDFEGKRWETDLLTYETKSIGDASPPTPGQGGGFGGRQGGQGQGGQGRANNSPDGKWVIEVSGGKLKVKSREDQSVAFEAKTDSIQFANWAPDSKHIAAFRCIPGDRRQVFLIQSSPASGGRANLRQRNYDLPGDKLDTFETFVMDFTSGTEIKSDLEPFFTGGQPWVGPPGVEWWNGGKSFLVDFAVRGYQEYKLCEVDVATAKARTVIDETSPTFVDSTALLSRPLPETQELIWRSERDGFGRLYLIDTKSGAVKNPITPPGWVVRSIEWLDAKERRLCFTANCTREGSSEDPYFIHFFTVGLDGQNPVRLTDGNGTHRVAFSPDRKYSVDTYSRADQAPIHELRKVSDGRRVLELEKADLTEWAKFNLPMPTPFVAKGRDGKTDIWGVVVRPSNFDPAKRYPIVENLYAGPQDSFVPKAFSPLSGMQRLAELGFIVVQIDGMGTRNRGKKFHDVCWKNLADAGLPDRILWMKALNAKHPYIDLDRVGVYGTSAGGQSATGALLFHPEFYKVAVSSCGCHDNRMDKFWWNEQWMGYPVGPEYEACSNITNASKLQGRLLLMVGELDTNVPPESTYRLVDALIKANKDFDFLVLPGSDHTGGGVLGERKRRDFFVRWLLGAQTPDWNRGGAGAVSGG